MLLMKQKRKIRHIGTQLAIIIMNSGFSIKLKINIREMKIHITLLLHFRNLMIKNKLYAQSQLLY